MSAHPPADRTGTPADAADAVHAGEHAAEVATLRVHHAGVVDLQRLRALLAPADWLGQPVELEGLDPAMPRSLAVLVLPLPPDGRLLSLRKAAFVDIGAPAAGGTDAFDVEIAWRSASLAPLFPVF